jgi:hypothetical protein
MMIFENTRVIQHERSSPKMVNICKKALGQLVVVLLAFGGLAFAACPDTTNNAGYVWSSASSGGTGASWSSAYRALPTTLVRGCTYYVAAGTYPGYTFNTADSGSTFITIQAPTASVHGTSTGWNASTMVGTAVWDTATSDGVGDILNFTTDYWIVNGVYRSTATGVPYTDWQLESGYGFQTLNTSAKACETDIGFGENSNSSPQPVHDIIFEYVDVSGSHATTSGGCRENGVESDWGSYNLYFGYNYIHNTGLTIFYMRGETANCSGSSGNVTCGSHASGYGTGENITIEYSYLYSNYSDPNQHAEGCSCSQGLQNLTIRYNYWQDINGTATIVGTATAADWNNGNGGNGPWYIYGNVAFQSSSDYMSGKQDANVGVADIFYKWDTTFIGAVYILNNTFYNFGGSWNSGTAIGMDDGSGDPSPATAFYVYNNLWSNSGAMNGVGSGLFNSCPSNAGYVDCTSLAWHDQAYFASTDTSYTSDTDSAKEVSSSAAPFVSATSPWNFALTADTTAGTLPANAGTYFTSSDTTATNTFNVDMFGVTRGANGTLDRGALQIGGGDPPPPQAPTNLTAVVH